MGRGAALAAAAWGAVWAAQAGGAAMAGEPVTLEELVVTSSGTGTPRATHAGNISKIDGDEIAFVRPGPPSEILNRIPGIGIQQGSGVEHLTAIRSPVLTGGAGAGSFLYLEDGVPMRAAGFANVNGLMEAMDEGAGGIEVVRGPGSALYGSNAEHGLINILSRAPSPSPEAGLESWFGPHGVRHLNGTASTAIAGQDGVSHGLRGSFALGADNGFRDRSGYSQEKAQLRYDYALPGTLVRATLTAVNSAQDTAGYITGHNAYKDDALRKANFDPGAYRDGWAVRGAIRIERELGEGQKLTLTPYARTNGMNFLMHFQPGQPIERNGHWSGGLLTGYHLDFKGGHQLVFGFDTEYTDGYLKENQSGATSGLYVQGLHYDYAVKALVLAPYVHSVWRLDPATALTAGLRFEYTRYDYRNLAANGIAGLFQRIPDRIDEFTDATPKLGLTHAFSDGLTGFVNLARGARAPQTADLYRLQWKQVPGEAKSETLDSIEIGMRGRVERLRYELAVWHMRKRDSYFRDANGFNVSNGRTRHTGIEAEFTAPLIWNFDLSASAAYARHTYDFDNIISSGSNSTETILKGNDVDTAPRTLANLRLGYSFAGERGRAELEWVHMGAYWEDAANTKRYPGHDLFNLRTEYALNANLSLFGRLANILDTRYADRADYFRGTERYFPGDGRGLYLGAALRL